VSNLKGFKLMAQVKPRLIIPTHNSLDASKEAVAEWAGLAALQPRIHLHAADLPEKTSILFIGSLAPSYQKIYNLPAVDW
jgi:hypothetical protein